MVVGFPVFLFLVIIQVSRKKGCTNLDGPKSMDPWTNLDLDLCLQIPRNIFVSYPEGGISELVSLSEPVSVQSIRGSHCQQLVDYEMI